MRHLENIGWTHEDTFLAGIATIRIHVDQVNFIIPKDFRHLDYLNSGLLNIALIFIVNSSLIDSRCSILDARYSMLDVADIQFSGYPESPNNVEIVRALDFRFRSNDDKAATFCHTREGGYPESIT